MLAPRWKISPAHRLAGIAASWLVLASAAHATQEWPGFRGPGLGGPAAVGALPAGELGLEVAWQQTLGSGYSSLAIAHGQVVTAFTSGADDVLAAFELTSGKERWRLVLGEKYAGHDGSDDGPVSTPAIDGTTVYALGPRGALVAADLTSGRELWRKVLDANNATVPFYGFTASPFVHGDLLILPTGGPGHAVTAFDKKTGAVRWAAGDDGVAYQSALVVTLAGREQIVAVTNQWVHGLSVADGKTLWKHPIATGNVQEESAHATPVGADRLLIDLNGNTTLLQIATDFAVKELWTSQAFANTLALPVYSNGSLYGFTGRFLTCVDVETGQIRWRSRPPGGQTLTLVDRSLAIVDLEGHLVLVAADPKEYRELAKVKALDRGDYAAPAFANGLFVVRNLSQIAAIKVVQGTAAPAAPAPTTAALPEPKGQFGQFLSRVATAPAAQRQAMVDEYFAKVTQTPIIEKDGTVHIVYRGKAQDVGVAGGFLPTDVQDVPLVRLEGTDLFYYGTQLDPAGNFEYGLSVDFQDPAPDPKNPYQFGDGFQEFSEIRMPNSPNVDYLNAPAADAAKGELLSFDFKSTTLGNTRRVAVYLPAGYAGAEGKFPVLVVNHGDRAQRAGLYVNSLDNLIGQKRMAPVVAVFVPRASGAEYGGPASANYVKFLAEELLPFVDQHYKTDSSQRALIGVGSAGVISAYAWITAPTAFARVATQSFYLQNPQFREQFYQALEKRSRGGQAVVEWSRQDYDIPRNNIDAKKDNAEWITKLKAAGYEVQVVETAGSANWQRWRSQTGTLLPALFPPKA